MITLDDLQRRYVVVHSTIVLAQQELECLDRLMAIYKSPQYDMPQSLPNVVLIEPTSTPTPAPSAYNTSSYRKLYAYIKQNRTEADQIKLTKSPKQARVIGIGSNSLCKYIDLMIVHGYLGTTSEAALYTILQPLPKF